MTELAPNNKLFSNNTGTNPYTPTSGSSIGQFKLPLDILPTATDEHGQILGEFLDQLFKYTSFGGSAGIEVCGARRPDCDQGSLIFSKELRELFIEAFVFNSINEKIEVYEKCVDDTSTQVKKFPDGDPTDEYPLGLCEGGKFLHFIVMFGPLIK